MGSYKDKNQIFRISHDRPFKKIWGAWPTLVPRTRALAPPHPPFSRIANSRPLQKWSQFRTMRLRQFSGLVLLKYFTADPRAGEGGKKTLLKHFSIEHWMIYRAPSLFAVVWFGSLPTSYPSFDRKLDRRHTGRLEKRNNLLTGVEGAESYDRKKAWSSKPYLILSAFSPFTCKYMCICWTFLLINCEK